jgi:2-hydroxy-6-oxonona-2,4-dienedioate hydrolase
MARISVGRAVANSNSPPGFRVIRLVFASYQHDIHQACDRISIGSQIAEMSCGTIEYVVVGDGPPILAVHGAGGGYDHGMDFSARLVQSGFRVIALSRLGYLRTPLPADASAAAQADAYACLLDALNIRRVAVIGLFAGAPSSMQFAIRHSERTTALVLMVPAAYPAHIEQKQEGAMPKQASTTAKFLIDTALKSDFLFWAELRLAPQTVIPAMLATPPAVLERASGPEKDGTFRLCILLPCVF